MRGEAGTGAAPPPADEGARPDERPGDEAPERSAERATTRVGRNAGVLMLGDLFDRGLGFAFLLAGTKFFGHEIYGSYVIALGAFQVVRALVSFGLNRSIVKDAAAADAVQDLPRLKGTIQVGFLLSLPLAVVSGAVLVFGAGPIVSAVLPKQPEVVEPLRVFGLLTPLFAFNFVLLQSLFGLGRIREMVVANNVVEPVARLVALLALFGAGLSGYYAIPGAYLIALVVSSVFGLFVFARDVWPRLAGVRGERRVKEALAFVLPLTLNDVATRSYRFFNVGVVAVFRTAYEVSILNVALKMTGVVFLFSGSLMAAFRPRIAALLATGERDRLSAETRVFTRWILTFALLPYGLMIAFPAEVLGVLGPQFVPAATTLRILCVGLLVGQAAGPLMALLVMSGRSRDSVLFFAAAGVCYTSLTLNLVPAYGTVGAALSALATILLFAPVISVYVQRRLGIRIYGRRMAKPLAAAALAFALGYLVSLALPAVDLGEEQHVLRIARGAAIAAVVTAAYVGALVKLGVEPEERAILTQAGGPLSKLRRKLKRLVS